MLEESKGLGLDLPDPLLCRPVPVSPRRVLHLGHGVHLPIYQAKAQAEHVALSPWQRVQGVFGEILRRMFSCDGMMVRVISRHVKMIYSPQPLSDILQRLRNVKQTARERPSIVGYRG